MNKETIVIPTGNVNGNITSCKIENQLIRIDRGSAVSLIEIQTRASYDVCSKQIIERYSVQELTGVAFVVGVMCVLTFITIMNMLFGNE